MGAIELRFSSGSLVFFSQAQPRRILVGFLRLCNLSDRVYIYIYIFHGGYETTYSVCTRNSSTKRGGQAQTPLMEIVSRRSQTLDRLFIDVGPLKKSRNERLEYLCSKRLRAFPFLWVSSRKSLEKSSPTGFLPAKEDISRLHI